MKALLRIIALIFAWLFLSGGTLFVSCSSDGDNDRRDDVLNRRPEAFDSTLLTVVDIETTGVLRAIDPDGDDLTYRILAGPTLGFVRITDPDKGTYTYISNATGADSFDFRANDGRLDSNTATVTVNIRNSIPAWRLVANAEEDREAGDWLRTQANASAATPPVVVLDTGAIGRGADDAGPELHASDPFDPERRLSAARDRVYLSTDGGASRSMLSLAPPLGEGDRVAVMAFNPYVSGLAYLLIERGQDASMYRSTDAGDSWLLASVGPKGAIAGFAGGPLRDDGSVRLVLRLRGQPGLYEAIDHPCL